MPTVEAETDQDESPVKGVRVRPKPLRLQPSFLDDLRNAKLDLGARYRIETDENVILNQFFGEAFNPWLASKLAPAAAAPATRKARNGKRDGEGEGGGR